MCVHVPARDSLNSCLYVSVSIFVYQNDCKTKGAAVKPVLDGVY